MTSEKTLKALGFRGRDDNLLISDVVLDSRDATSGCLFAALPGHSSHGAHFAKTAVSMGAGAILTDERGAAIAKEALRDESPVLWVDPQPRKKLAQVAGVFFDRQPEILVAVTGTNGKTSVASFVQQIWSHLDIRAVNFGTTGVEGALSRPLKLTTPDTIALHKLLTDLAREDVTHAAMEASSHGLDQFRLDGVKLSAAGFTNFQQDHLDYHESFAEYFEAKMGLFERVLPKDAPAVVNIDDPTGAEVAKRARQSGHPVMSYGFGDADLSILGYRSDDTGQDLSIAYRGARARLRLDLIGQFQGANALCAIGLALSTGASFEEVIKAARHLAPVRGRMQLAAKRRSGAAVFVDYAHTPDALLAALAALRPHVLGRIVLVFGAGGDRDKSKRVLMGQAAAAGADHVIVTDDNPRSEPPSDIRDEILKACPNALNIGDRAEAILMGVDALKPGDALLIAGKGHETGQIIGEDVFPFDDCEQASIAVSALDEVVR